MKKTKIWTIVGVVIIVLCGVFYATQKSNTNQVNASYDRAMSAGKNAVANKEYAEASAAFGKALSIKKTDQAQAYKEQSDNMTNAISSTKDGEYDDALTQASNVINKDGGYAVLASQGRNLRTTIKEVQDNYDHEIKPIFKVAAKDETDKQYIKAADQYQKVLDLPYIDGKFYAKYKKQAQKGLKNNKKAAAGDTSGIAGSEGSSSDSDLDTGNAGKTGEGSMGDHTVNGKTVTGTEIAQLRKRVAKFGYDAMSWSPQDLIDLYRKSGRTSPSMITKKDVQNYLKP